MSKKPTKFLDVNGRVIDDTSARYLTTVCTSVSREQFDEPEIRVPTPRCRTPLQGISGHISRRLRGSCDARRTDRPTD